MSSRRHPRSTSHEAATRPGWSRPGTDDSTRQVSWLRGSLPDLFVVKRGSPLTVAGTAPDLHRLPFSPPFRAGTCAEGGGGGRAWACQISDRSVEARLQFRLLGTSQAQEIASHENRSPS